MQQGKQVYREIERPSNRSRRTRRHGHGPIPRRIRVAAQNRDRAARLKEEALGG